MHNWFLPVNLHVELFEMCITVIPFYSIRRFNDRYILYGSSGDVLLDFIYIQRSGWVELLFYDREVNSSEEEPGNDIENLWQHNTEQSKINDYRKNLKKVIKNLDIPVPNNHE